MGTAVDSDGSRHIWVADPAAFGGITGYWCRVEEIARLIVPHAYAFASAVPAAQPTPAPAPTTPAPSTPQSAPADSAVTVRQSDWDKVWRTYIEWRAIEFGDQDSVGAIVTSAKTGDARAMSALSKLESVNPSALKTYIATKG